MRAGACNTRCCTTRMYIIYKRICIHIHIQTGIWSWRAVILSASVIEFFHLRHTTAMSYSSKHEMTMWQMRKNASRASLWATYTYIYTIPYIYTINMYIGMHMYKYMRIYWYSFISLVFLCGWRKLFISQVNYIMKLLSRKRIHVHFHISLFTCEKCVCLHARIIKIFHLHSYSKWVFV